MNRTSFKFSFAIDKVFISVFILNVFSFHFSSAQNLCPNPGFESFSNCPSTLSQVIFAAPWSDANGSTTTCDLYNACHVNNSPLLCTDVGVPLNFGGNVPAHGGDGYAGFLAKYGANIREYLQAPLITPLVAGTAYNVEVYFLKAPESNFASNNLGLFISSGPLFQSGAANIGGNPQFEITSVVTDTVNWTLLSGIYFATGGENYITIGNFKDDFGTTAINVGSASTCGLMSGGAYYFVDDVKVEPINEYLNIVGDTLICTGDTTLLTANTNASFYWWSTGALPNDTFSLQNSIKASNISGFQYILHGVVLSDTATLYVVNPPVVNLGNDTSICEYQQVTLDATNINSVYTWSTGSHDSSIVVNSTGNYFVTVDNGGCKVSDSINITVLTNPPIDFGSDNTFCIEEFDTLELDAGDGNSYFWQPTAETTQAIQVIVQGLYSVVVNHPNGCTTTDSVFAFEYCKPKIFVPNAFTPNDDATNEYWFPVASYIISIKVQVYNRYGQRVFYSDNPLKPWDGTCNKKPCPSGVYAYVVDYTAPTKTIKIDKKRISGTVIIFR